MTESKRVMCWHDNTYQSHEYDAPQDYTRIGAQLLQEETAPDGYTWSQSWSMTERQYNLAQLMKGKHTTLVWEHEEMSRRADQEYYRQRRLRDFLARTDAPTLTEEQYRKQKDLYTRIKRHK